MLSIITFICFKGLYRFVSYRYLALIYLLSYIINMTSKMPYYVYVFEGLVGLLGFNDLMYLKVFVISARGPFIYRKCLLF